MAIREYKCNDCNLITEEIILGAKPVAPTIICPKCKGEAQFLAIPTGFSLGVSSFSEAPIDNIIGKDADRRWEDIYKRQEIRDKVRKETGSVGLSMVGRNEFAPLAEEVKIARTELNEVIPFSGFKPAFDSPEDAKLINNK